MHFNCICNTDLIQKFNSLPSTFWCILVLTDAHIDALDMHTLNYAFGSFHAVPKMVLAIMHRKINLEVWLYHMWGYWYYLLLSAVL